MSFTIISTASLPTLKELYHNKEKENKLRLFRVNAAAAAAVKPRVRKGALEE